MKLKFLLVLLWKVDHPSLQRFLILQQGIALVLDVLVKFLSVFVCMCRSIPVEVRGQLSGTGCLFPPHGIEGWDSGCQTLYLLNHPTGPCPDFGTMLKVILFMLPGLPEL